MVIVMKICTKCKIEKELSEFHVQAAGKFGRKGSCKECSSKYFIKYRSIPEVKDAKKKYDSQPHVMAKKRKSSYAYSKTEAGDKNRRDYRCTDTGKSSTAKSVERDRIEHPEKHRARQLAYNARRRGELIREPCEVCGDVKVHAHHDDYAEPLKVRWLCNSHHAEWHKLHGVF